MLLAKGNPKKAKCRYSVRTNLKRKNEMNLLACLLVHKEICDELKNPNFWKHNFERACHKTNQQVEKSN